MTAIWIAIWTIALGSAFYLGSRVNAEPWRLEEIQARISVLSGEISQLGTRRQELENEQTELTTVADSKRAEITQLQQEAEWILGL